MRTQWNRTNHWKTAIKTYKNWLLNCKITTVTEIILAICFAVLRSCWLADLADVNVNKCYDKLDGSNRIWNIFIILEITNIKIISIGLNLNRKRYVLQYGLLFFEKRICMLITKKKKGKAPITDDRLTILMYLFIY